MAALQTTFTWIAYAIVVALFMLVTAIFVFIYQEPRERSPAVTIVSIITLTSLLATVLLLPVDIALIASTSYPKLGRKKNWATPERVNGILHTLKIVYYTLYSFDALLCLVVAPFTYFWYEEYDDTAEDSGGQSMGKRFWAALKYTLVFVVLVVILFLVGFFVPIARDRRGKHWDLDYFKDLLTENREPLCSARISSRV
jgi:LMBR1 domain-containing protein 1